MIHCLYETRRYKMIVNSDYFLLYHGLLQADSESVALHPEVSRDTLIELSSLILSMHRKNFNLLSSLDYFSELSIQLSPLKITTIDILYALQATLLNQIQEGLQAKDFEHLDAGFTFLHQSNILTSQQYEQLHTLFDPSKLAPRTQISTAEDKAVHSDFLQEKQSYLSHIEKLLTLSHSPTLCGDLRDTLNYIHKQRFSIGITGVMNAGKSTLLNALMGAEILGSSVIPETANLSVVSYSTQALAKVHFWDSKEWETLVQSASKSEAMEKFIDETRQAFGEQLTDYITQPSTQVEIETKDLSLYTSAAKSSLKCNLVKYVELHMQVDFLSDGIEIVDTPGLDDPVVQREEITKEYMANCDLMIHLMNVSQSATLKDVEFIIDALLYQNVSALLIIITRSDTVSQQQLTEVINYTKSSITQALEDLDQATKIDAILAALHFLPISGYMALQHRTGKAHHALEAGFPLEKTGILELESYLKETLFGSKSVKNKLIISGIDTRLQRALNKEVQTMQFELSLLNKDEAELEEELKKFAQQKEINESELKLLEQDIKQNKEQLLLYIESLESFISSALMKLQALIKTRLINELKYKLEKEKKQLTPAQIKNILLTALKDGIIDILRDYRYKCLKKMDAITQHMSQKYKKHQLSMDSLKDFDASLLFKDSFASAFLSTNHDIFLQTLKESMAKSSLKKLDTTSAVLEKLLSDYLLGLQNTLLEKARSFTQTLTEDFFTLFKAPIKDLRQALEEQENIISRYKENFSQESSNQENKALEIHKSISQLQKYLEVSPS